MKKLSTFLFVLLIVCMMASAAHAMHEIEATITSAPPAGGSWATDGSNAYIIPAAYNNSDTAQISISGTWVATVTLQRSHDNGVTWHDVKTYTSNAEEAVEDAYGPMRYRLGIKNTEFSSGSCVVWMGRP